MAKCLASDLVRVFSQKSEFIEPDRTKRRVRTIRDRILLWKVTETVTEEVKCQQKHAGEFAYSNGRRIRLPPARARREREESRPQQTAHTGPLVKDEAHRDVLGAWHLRRTQISKRNYQVNLVRTLNYPYKLYFE
jgi:hypothetical protein